MSANRTERKSMLHYEYVSYVEKTKSRRIMSSCGYLCYWSEWRDSNPRHPAPKRRRERFSIGEQPLPALSVPQKILSGALISIVSTRSKSRYGQTCGQKQNRSRQAPQTAANLRERSYGNSVSSESQLIFSFPTGQNLRRINKEYILASALRSRLFCIKTYPASILSVTFTC